MNLTVGHEWRPIEDLPEDHENLRSSELENLAQVWREQRNSLDETETRRFLNRLKREWAIETGIIEQLYTLDRGITATLIEHGIDASLIPHDATDRPPELLAEILHDQEEAIDWVFDLIKGDQSFSQGAGSSPAGGANVQVSALSLWPCLLCGNPSAPSGCPESHPSVPGSEAPASAWPPRGSGADAPHGALRAIDSSARPRLLADLRSAPPAAASQA
jgi:hypothetical protein